MPHVLPNIYFWEENQFYMSYLDELNDSQRVAVEHIYGATMVIAGAGSGKTRVLTYRIAYMMEQGIDPFNILALTFTNKAAREMTERIGKIVGGGEAKNISMGTFHSVFSKLLRFNADRIGFPNNFTIYDTDDCKSVIKEILKQLNLDDKIALINLEELNNINSLFLFSISEFNFNLLSIAKESRIPKKTTRNSAIYLINIFFII